MVSISDVPNPDYNVAITVIGPKKEKVRELMQDFQKKIGIETREPPDYFYKRTEKVRKLIEEL